jgi:1-acyl-sn-glycerol-3-phosphate acyltransferase
VLVRSEPHAIAPATPSSTPDADARARRVLGLLAASLYPTEGSQRALTFVTDFDDDAIARVRREALALRVRHGAPVTVELRYVTDARAASMIATLADLAAHEVRIVTTPIGGQSATRVPAALAALRGEVTSEPVAAPAIAPGASPARAAVLSMHRAGVSPPSATMTASLEALRAAADAMTRPEPAPPRIAVADEHDPFGLDRAFRAYTIPIFQFMFEQYWRTRVSGMENVPATGPGLVVANHSGAVPADAFMLAAALELRHPERRCLRVLYDKFVDALPFVGDLYRRLGGVSASLPNAERLLRRGELVGLFPEGIAGVEKRCTERYRLRPFKTGTARLSVRTGSPVIPVAIVGAEEAYPVVARLYRVGRLVGVPWIPVTPLFPVCGIAGALPLPSKWSMHFGTPIPPPPADGRSEDARVAELTSRIRAAIESSLCDLLAKRDGIFL